MQQLLLHLLHLQMHQPIVIIVEPIFDDNAIPVKSTVLPEIPQVSVPQVSEPQPIFISSVVVTEPKFEARELPVACNVPSIPQP